MIIKLPSIAFRPNHLSDIKSWHGHVFFACDLIFNVKPSVIVELGVHKGDSLLTMSQICSDFLFDTELYGVDHWEGDPQSGFYQSNVYEDILKTSKKYFNNLNLIRGNFNEVVNRFSDESIDILHIDGFHSYKEVKNDFDTWFPKVKKTGVIMLHDICSKSEDFGVNELWKDLKKRFNYAEFYLSQGLGVIFLSEFNFNSPYLDRISDPAYCDYFNSYYSLMSNILRNRLDLDSHPNPFDFQILESESLSLYNAAKHYAFFIFLPKIIHRILLWIKTTKH